LSAPLNSMKKICSIVLGLSGLLIAAGNLRAFTVNMTDDGAFLSWPPERTAIFYRIGSSGFPVDREAVEEMGRAFAEWEAKSRGEISFVYEGLLPESEAVQDGHNTLVWVSGVWPHGPEIAAVSTIWHSEETGQIEEVDIEFNARDYDWNLPGSPDLLETALHEIGHLLGIGHSFNPGAVMHDTRYPGVPSRRILSRDDFEALSFLHPRREREVFSYDLPVLFYPRYFPGEAPVFPPGPGFEPGSARWISPWKAGDRPEPGKTSSGNSVFPGRSLSRARLWPWRGLITTGTGPVARRRFCSGTAAGSNSSFTVPTRPPPARNRFWTWRRRRPITWWG